MIQHILGVARKEFIQLSRDRRTLPLILVAPVLQLLLFGYAATQDVRNVRLALVDQSQTPLSRDIGRALSASGTFQVFAVADRAELQAAMLRGNATVGLVLAPDFERELVRGSSAGVEVFADGSDPNTATVAAAYVQRILARVITDLISARYPALVPRPTVELVPRVLYNPNLASRNYMVPGVLVMILLIMTTIMTSVAIVREHERGTIEQLVVTPLLAIHHPPHLVEVHIAAHSRRGQCRFRAGQPAADDTNPHSATSVSWSATLGSTSGRPGIPASLLSASPVTRIFRHSSRNSAPVAR